jgi:hypothetical protein
MNQLKPAARVNVSRASIRQHVELRLSERLKAQGINVDAKRPTAKELHEQAAFLAGAMTALQAVFGCNAEENRLVDYCPPAWIIDVMRGERVGVAEPAEEDVRAVSEA